MRQSTERTIRALHASDRRAYVEALPCGHKVCIPFNNVPFLVGTVTDIRLRQCCVDAIRALFDDSEEEAA